MDTLSDCVGLRVSLCSCFPLDAIVSDCHFGQNSAMNSVTLSELAKDINTTRFVPPGWHWCLLAYLEWFSIWTNRQSDQSLLHTRGSGSSSSSSWWCTDPSSPHTVCPKVLLLLPSQVSVHTSSCFSCSFDIWDTSNTGFWHLSSYSSTRSVERWWLLS